MKTIIKRIFGILLLIHLFPLFFLGLNACGCIEGDCSNIIAFIAGYIISGAILVALSIGVFISYLFGAFE